MIISASRRTDIPSFYTDWFLKRIQEKQVWVRNPMNAHQISRIDLSPEVVDGIVFWTKNPKPILERLKELKDYAYYFQYTINPYGREIEEHLPPLKERMELFKTLSEMIGKERVIWRYDPIILNNTYNPQYHLEQFAYMADELAPYTKKCVFSYLDFYTKMKNRMKQMGIRPADREEKEYLAEAFSKTASRCGIVLETCAEDIDLEKYGILHGRCIDDKLLSQIIECPLKVEKDKNQRLECGCAASIDIGLYNTCKNGCVYCYANLNQELTIENNVKYDRNSPLLCSALGDKDIVKDRNVKSLKERQLSLF
ncbi:DUF1848 domain-containing protein [uncultured Robinsoniella sp.]|uniref:DUF1848 domain-containing protein n=1 Tax=uncultured Robinsoniella sp. TaxID=904190 RepID=UPI00374F1D21